jgi:hypothetical protein
VSIQLGPEWRDFENRLGRYPQVSETELRGVLNRSLVMIEADARRAAPQDTRRLSGSIVHEITGAYPSLAGRVGPSVLYGVFVEFGRRPRRTPPPIAALMPWVRRHWKPAFHGPLLRGQLRPRRAATLREASDEQVRRRARALAIAIGFRGIPARPYLVPAYRRNQATIEALFASIGTRVNSWLAGGPL